MPDQVTTEGSVAESIGNPTGGTTTDPFSVPLLSESSASTLLRNQILDTVSEGHLAANYTYAIIHTTYESDEGVRVGSKTGDVASSANGRDTNVVVRVRRRRTIKTVSWTVQRMYIKPVLPHWNSGNPNEVLLSKTISVQNPSLGINQRVWSASGVYTYTYKREPLVVVNGVERLILPVSVPPTERASAPMYSYDQGDFDFRQLDSSWVPASGYFQDGDLPIGFNGQRVASPDSPIAAPQERFIP